MPTHKPTTEELDTAQFGQVIHDRPGAEMMAATTGQGIHEVTVDLRVLLNAAEARALKAEEGEHYANGVAELAMKHRDEAEAALIKAEGALREIVRHADRMNDPNRRGNDPDVIDMGNIARAALETNEAMGP